MEIEKEIAPRRIIAADYDEWYDGRLCRGPGNVLLYLDQWPIISLGTVTENGVALTAGKGYSTTLQVLIQDADGILRRRAGGGDISVLEAHAAAGFPYSRGWSAGDQNIRVPYRAGYEVDQVPRDLQIACAELGRLIFRQVARSGTAGRTRSRGSTTFAEALPERTRAIIHRHSPLNRPRMRAAAV